MDTILVFLLFLCPLIFFHELGHFLFAKLFKVKVEVFSLGFGPKILKKVVGETEYAFSLIPLGGYVKMYGDDPFKKRDTTDPTFHQMYVSKNAWQKFLIVFGGPLANFLLAFALYSYLPIKGEQTTVFTLGDISESTVLKNIGLRSGDEILNVQGKIVRGVEDLAILRGDIGPILISRGGEEISLNIPLGFMDFFEEVSKSMYLQSSKMVNLKGEVFKLAYPQNPTEFSLQHYFEQSLKGDLVLHLMDSQNKIFKEVSIPLGKLQEVLDAEQLLSFGLVVDDVLKNSPADQSKILKGDILWSLNGVRLLSFMQMRNQLQQTTTEQVDLEIYRKGEKIQLSLKPEIRDVGNQKLKTIGITSSVDALSARQRIVKIDNFFEAIKDGFFRMLIHSKRTIDGFVALFSMPDPLEMIGGPVKIAQVAKASLVISIDHFLRLMALISINLAILNLLPVPVLDGGHIVFITLEAFTGKQLPQRVLEWSYKIGFALLMSFVMVALYNDIFR
jgi:regulator of sigma E protease